MPSAKLDLRAYLDRIGLAATGVPDLALLRAVIAHHTAAIPFENLDIILGRPIRLCIDALQAKLVDAKRGGYCFEQNTLLQAALEALGFNVTSLMARVLVAVPADTVTPLTHMLLRVDLAEGSYLADVAFGNFTPTAPLMLDRTDVQKTDHEAYRLSSVGAERLLHIRLGEAWQQIYRFADRPTYPADHEVANWYMFTRPNTLFTANLIAARPGVGCRMTMFNADVTIRHLQDEKQHFKTVTPAAMEMALQEHFGIIPGAEDLASLYEALCKFAAQPDRGFRLD